MDSPMNEQKNPCVVPAAAFTRGGRCAALRRGARAVSFVLVGAAVSAPACRNTADPTPTSKPAIPFPSGVPEATALANLALVRDLEAKATGRSMILVSISTYPVSMSGRILPGRSPWGYSFAEASTSSTRLDHWYVRADGRVGFLGTDEQPVVRLTYRELQPDAQLDSDRAAELALQYGGQRFVDKYPGSLLGMTCEWIYGRPTWHVTFRNFELAGNVCADEVYLDAGSGTLLSHLPAYCL